MHYREYLQNLSMLDLINFKLPWLESEVTKEGGTVQLIDSYEEAKARRQRTIARIRQMEQLEQTMEQLRNERRRNKDEAAEVRVGGNIYCLLPCLFLEINLIKLFFTLI